MNEASTVAPFPVMDVFCANCHECYHETLPDFDPQAPRSDTIKLKDFWAIECGWQPIPPEVAGLDGEFLCPSCGDPMARDNGTLWLAEPGQVPDYGSPVPPDHARPHVPEELDSEPSKGDMLEAELAANAEEQKANEEEIERKQKRALTKAEKDRVIVQMRDREKLTFREIARRIGSHESYPGKRYHTVKAREKREKEKARKQKKIGR